MIFLPNVVARLIDHGKYSPCWIDFVRDEIACCHNLIFDHFTLIIIIILLIEKKKNDEKIIIMMEKTSKMK